MTHLRTIVPSLLLLTSVIWLAGCGQSEKGELAAESSAPSQSGSEPATVAPSGAAKANEDTHPSAAAKAKAGTEPKPVAPIVDGKNSNDEVPQPKKRVPLEPTGVETLELIETVLGKESEAFLGRGDNGLTFNETKDSLTNKKLIAGRMAYGEFFRLKDNREVLFTPSGDLVGIAYLHSKGDNDRTSAKLMDLFGKPEPENVEKFSTSSSSTLRVTYHFPNVIVVVRYVFETTVVFNEIRKAERVFVDYFDRRWVVQQLAAHIEYQSKAFERFAEVVEAGSIPGVELEKLPSWPESRIDEKKALRGKAYYWVPNIIKDTGGEKKTPRNPNAPDPSWFASLVTSSPASLDHPKGTALTTLRVPNDRRCLLEKTNLSFLLIRVNSAMAQETFPPRGESITVKTAGTAKSFEWLTKDYLIVQVNADNSLVVARRPN